MTKKELTDALMEYPDETPMIIQEDGYFYDVKLDTETVHVGSVDTLRCRATDRKECYLCKKGNPRVIAVVMA